MVALAAVQPDFQEADSYQMTLRCGGEKCQHHWTETFPLPMRIDVWGRRLKAIECPKCAGRVAEFYVVQE